MRRFGSFFVRLYLGARASETDVASRLAHSVTKGCVHATRSVPSIDAPVVVRVLKAGDVFNDDAFLSGGATHDYVAAGMF
jgi:hypothetical protein